MKNEIAICNCGEPLIFTMAFTGSEYYCLMCGATYGCFSIKTTESTKELKYTQNMYKKIFKLIYKDFIPYGCYHSNCEKCKKNKDTHIEHATNKELFKSDMALKILNKIAREVNDNER